MTVLVDTSVWSLALRRKTESDLLEVRELQALIDELRVQLIGPIRQELLSGIPNQNQFERLRERLRAFPDLQLSTADYERAAEFFNVCRGQGIQGSNTDFLICAVAAQHGYAILTTDKDFQLYQRHLPFQLHAVREEIRQE
ncbi:MAG TPA: PIN domain-containing protein [Candidatus Binatia bacterium]|nr:PIN domain-containing protein [Candidatus Binatia bacterium]